MPPDLWSLYALMLRSRLFEEAVAQLWKGGFISGEMHLGTGEEAVVAGVVAQLGSEDAMALDHRGTAALLMRGADPVPILKELLGLPDGLCGGKGGHMHLLSKRHLTAASGIVGAAAPAAVGFALAAERLRPGTVAVAFFGEGAMNQGMLMESLNLAAAWNLPVVFVCKDDRWSITTQSDTVTAGDLEERARGLGVPAVAVDGGEVTKVWEAASDALDRARGGGGPTFLHARCVHLEGHFLGFQMIRLLREPLREAPKIAIPLAGSFLRRGGAPAGERMAGLMALISSVLATMRDPRRELGGDPIRKTRTRLRSDLARLHALEDEAEREVKAVVAAAMAAEAAS